MDRRGLRLPRKRGGITRGCFPDLDAGGGGSVDTPAGDVLRGHDQRPLLVKDPQGGP
jgi:hypothetical protein